ncbi:MAG TPA: hypothetical protein VLH56_15740 [Dissulfurispiraceae bacterium]|nr:hypothetical protein [Dissulfurispiraceae bacterium]
MKKENDSLHHVSDRIRKKLLEFHQNAVPDYVVDAGKSHVTLRLADDLCNYRDYVVTICQVHEFFVRYNKKREPIMALGGYVGEEAYMRNIALECLRWFKFVSPEEFREKKHYPNEP